MLAVLLENKSIYTLMSLSCVLPSTQQTTPKGIIYCDTDKESNHIQGEQLFVLVMHHFNPHKIPQYEFVPTVKTTHKYVYLVTYLSIIYE